MMSIELDNTTGVFLPGRTVNGRILMVSDDVTWNYFQSLSLICKGVSKVSFGNYLCHTASKEFYKHVVALPTAPLDDQILLTSNPYSFMFTFDLPARIPSSFAGAHGCVQYVLAAKVVLSNGIRHKTLCSKEFKTTTEFATLEFKVNILADLNLNPVAKMPVSAMESKHIRRYFSLQSGPVNVQAYLSQCGYSPGQILYFNATVNNLSGISKIKSSTVRLIQYTRYNANGIVKICTCVIRKATHGPFDQSDVWSNVPFLVPSLPPTDEGPDNLIQISYRIELIIDPGTFASKVTLVSMDVIIGANASPTAPIVSDIFGNVPIVSPTAPVMNIIPPNDLAGYQHQASRIPSAIDAPPKYEE